MNIVKFDYLWAWGSCWLKCNLNFLNEWTLVSICFFTSFMFFTVFFLKIIDFGKTGKLSPFFYPPKTN